MTPFEEHVRKYRPDSVTAKLSRECERLRTLLAQEQAHTFQYEAEKAEPGMLLAENEKLRAIVRGLAVTINHCLQCGATWDYLGGQEKHRPGCLATPLRKEKKG